MIDFYSDPSPTSDSRWMDCLAAGVDRPKNWLPFPRNPLFQTRPGEFERLETELLFDIPRQPARSGLVGLVGLGGVGKTQLAIEFAYRNQHRFSAGIFWMPATGNSIFDWQHQLAELANNTGYLPPDDNRSNSDYEIQRARHFCRYLATHKDALMILDNVENTELIRSALPTLAGENVACSTLYTSRNQKTEMDIPGVATFPVELLSEERALRLLLETTKPLLLAEIVAGSLDTEADAARFVCQRVGYLPLALVHLRGLLADKAPKPLTLARLAEKLTQQGALELAKKRRDGAASLFATFWLSWEKVESEDSRRLFKLASYFPEAAPIPLWLLGLAASLGEDGDIFEPLGKACNQLWEWSLLELLSEGQVRMHPLIREFGQRLIAEEGADTGQILRSNATDRLTKEFIDLDRLEQRVKREGYWGCLEQVRKAKAYMALLDASQIEQIERIERGLDSESHLLAENRWWPDPLPGLFYQQLFNHAIEEGSPYTVREHTARWLRQLGQAGAKDRSLLKIFSGHTGYVYSVAFSPDGNLVLTSSETARLWKADSGQLLAVLPEPDGPVLDVAFSPDGSRLLTRSLGGTARLWRADGGQLLSTLDKKDGVHDNIDSMAFSPNGKLVLTRSDDGMVRLWTADDGQLLGTITTSAVRCVGFSADGSRLLTGSDDGTLRQWGVSSRQLLSTLQIDAKSGIGGTGLQMRFSSSGRLVFTSVYTGSVQFTPTGPVLPQKHQVWQVNNGQLLSTLQGNGTSLNGATFSPDDNQILAGSDDHAAYLWQVSNGSLLAIFPGHTARVLGGAFSADGSRLLTGSDDHTARLLQLGNQQLLSNQGSHTDKITSLVFSPDGCVLLTGSDDGTVQLWQTDSGKLLTTWEGHIQWVYCVAFSPDGSLALTGSADGTARLWQVSSGQLLSTLEHPDGRVYSVAFLPDGNYVRTGTGQPFFGDGATWLWQVSNGQLLGTSRGSFGEVVWSLAISPNHDQIFIGSGNHMAGLYESSSGKCLTSLKGHTEWVDRVAFSPDSSLVLTGSWDKTARLWETSSGKQLAALEGHTDHVSYVAFSPDGRLAITCDPHGWVFFWQTSGMDIGRLLGLYVAEFAVGAVHWLTTDQVILVDTGGRGDRPHFYRLKLEGI